MPQTGTEGFNIGKKYYQNLRDVDAVWLVSFVSVETDPKSGTGCDDKQTDIQQGYTPNIS